MKDVIQYLFVRPIINNKFEEKTCGDGPSLLTMFEDDSHLQGLMQDIRVRISLTNTSDLGTNGQITCVLIVYGEHWNIHKFQHQHFVHWSWCVDMKHWCRSMCTTLTGLLQYHVVACYVCIVWMALKLAPKFIQQCWMVLSFFMPSIRNAESKPPVS